MKDSYIQSILDTDLYKLTMMQAVSQQFPTTNVRYEFKNRGGDKFPALFDVFLKQHINAMSRLQLTPDEKKWLGMFLKAGWTQMK